MHANLAICYCSIQLMCFGFFNLYRESSWILLKWKEDQVNKHWVSDFKSKSISIPSRLETIDRKKILSIYKVFEHIVFILSFPVSYLRGFL